MSVSDLHLFKKYLLSCKVPLDKSELDRLALKKRAAVQTIMQQHDQPWEGSNFTSLFGEFLQKCPSWAEYTTNTVVFFRNPKYEQHHHLMTLRRQTTGYCGAHAAVQLLHYLMDIRSDGSQNVGTVDIAADMKLGNLYGRELLNYLLDGKGLTKPLYYFAALGTLDVTRFLGFAYNTPYTSVKCIAGNRTTSAEIMAQLAVQPGMVTNFTATPFFVRSPLVSFHVYKPQIVGNEGAHAMLIIGARQVDDDYFFLLQYWHPQKQFVEVSAEYLASCGAVVLFVDPAQVITLPHMIPLTAYPATECTIVEYDGQDEDSDDEWLIW